MNTNQAIQLAPIAIFTYKRLDTLIKCIEALQKSEHAKESLVYIFSDGPKKEKDKNDILKVREYIKTISGFKNVITKFSEVNKGLAKSIIGGVTEIVNKHNSIIVLEDDLIVSSNFLSYMNSSLKYYKDDNKVFSIAGYTPPVKAPKNYKYDNYFTLRGSSWGWATWKNSWNDVDWEISDYNEFLKDKLRQKQFNKMGSDMCKMLDDQKNGKINSWAIRWTYHQFKTDQYTVFPILSKISNVGFGGGATHTAAQDDKRFETPLDISGKKSFNFNPEAELEKTFIKQFVSVYSLRTRIYYKIRKLLKL